MRTDAESTRRNWHFLDAELLCEPGTLPILRNAGRTAQGAQRLPLITEPLVPPLEAPRPPVHSSSGTRVSADTVAGRSGPLRGTPAGPCRPPSCGTPLYAERRYRTAARGSACDPPPGETRTPL